jgi:hypothetical protein
MNGRIAPGGDIETGFAILRIRITSSALGLALMALPAVAGWTSTCAAERATAGEAPTPMHLFLLAGQSNMAGRGAVTDIDRTPHPRVHVLDAHERWVPAIEPLHFDKPKIAGVGPGLAFARAIADACPDIGIGLVPAAVGGSSIETWVPGGYHSQTGSHPWDDAVRRLHVAARAGTLMAILWHQGEADSGPEKADAYAARLDDLIHRFREAAGDPELPFIVGQLGQFREWTPGRRMVDAAHRNAPNRTGHSRFVPSDGLTHKGDGTHFDAASARELGRRYAAAYIDMTGGCGDGGTGR